MDSSHLSKVMTSIYGTTFGYVNLSRMEPDANKAVAADAAAADSSCQHFYLEAQAVTGLFLTPVICLFGLLGNVMSIVVLRTLKMRISTKTYLVGMAVSDATKLVNDSFYFLVTLIIHIDGKTGHACYSYLYPYAHFLFNASSCTTAWLTVSVAYERFILVCYPTVSRISCSAYRARLTTAVVFVLSTVVSLPFLFRYHTVLGYGVQRRETLLALTPYAQGVSRPHNYNPHFSQLQHQYSQLPALVDVTLSQTQTYSVNVTNFWKDHETLATVYNWIHGSIRSLIPLMLLCVLTFLIVRASKRTRTIMKRTLSAKQRVTLTLISVIVLFVVCIAPDAVLSTFLGFGYHEEPYCVKTIREVTDLLLTINSAANFVLYCSFNRGFRKTLASTASKHCGCCRRHCSCCRRHLAASCCLDLASQDVSVTTKVKDPVNSRNSTIHRTSNENGGENADQTNAMKLETVNVSKDFLAVPQMTAASHFGRDDSSHISVVVDSGRNRRQRKDAEKKKSWKPEIVSVFPSCSWTK